METDAAATVYRNAAGKPSYSRTFMLKESILTTDTLIDALSGYIDTRSDGTVVYHNAQGETHRTTGPAIIQPNGDEYWLQNGRYHRTDGPAVIQEGGYVYWFLNDMRLSEEEFNQRIASGEFNDT